MNRRKKRNPPPTESLPVQMIQVTSPVGTRLLPGNLRLSGSLAEIRADGASSLPSEGSRR
jgi:hypothetical protein